MCVFCITCAIKYIYKLILKNRQRGYVVALTKVPKVADAQSVDTHLLATVQENVSKGLAAIKDITGLTISPPSEINIFNDRTYSGKGFFDEANPSAINLNARYANNLSATLYVLYPYLRFQMFAEAMSTDDESPGMPYYGSDSCLFIEIGAADFFARAVSKYAEHPEDKSKYLLLHDMLDDWSVEDARNLKYIYDILSEAPKAQSSVGALLRGRPDAISEELNTYIDKLILEDKESLAHIAPIKEYDWGWMYSFGRLIFALMYVAHEFNSAEVISEHFTSTNEDVLAHLAELIQVDVKRNAISDRLVTLMGMLQERDDARHNA